MLDANDIANVVATMQAYFDGIYSYRETTYRLAEYGLTMLAAFGIYNDNKGA